MLRPLTFLAAVGLALTGCDASDAETDTPAPPAVAAFVLDTDAFPSDGARVASGAHFINAAARVGIVSTVVGLHLVLPGAATEAVTADSPTVTAGVWMWEATTAVNGTPIDLALEGTPEGSSIDWRLVVTGPEGDPFTYYTATTGLDGETGTWRLFAPDADGPVLTASFDVRDLDDRELTFRVPAGRDHGGSSVRYATDGDERTFDWTDQPTGDRALIVWDDATRAGSITADTYYGGDRACWDEDLDDVACD
ncbi:hypothetical protein [Rubrivirga marina]|uniref:Lipoprotein n=1 Tax=Rubrivirga marina TaxID=1196024 RepID=A0A271J514_9BACT|nr:hypothetical protein [Rubrivirga marina]PAP78523.1 hypothetical protein BSZ37_19885 [Rubrivirga marina]